MPLLVHHRTSQLWPCAASCRLLRLDMTQENCKKPSRPPDDPTGPPEPAPPSNVCSKSVAKCEFLTPKMPGCELHAVPHCERFTRWASTKLQGKLLQDPQKPPAPPKNLLKPPELCNGSSNGHVTEFLATKTPKLMPIPNRSTDQTYVANSIKSHSELPRDPQKPPKPPEGLVWPAECERTPAPVLHSMAENWGLGPRWQVASLP